MSLADLQTVSVLLRAVTYIATIAVAAAILFRISFRVSKNLEPALKRQIKFGAILLFVCELSRYFVFQLNISGGDSALAFDPAMRWMAFETAMGQALAVRVIATLVILFTGLGWLLLSVPAALILISSYLLEGHTVAYSDTGLLPTLLFVHLVAACWWIGSLVPLWVATVRMPDEQLVALVFRFGQISAGMVITLVLGGSLLLGNLSGWQIDLTNSYQQAFAIKLATFAGIMLIAAVNKFALTPLLERKPERGRKLLQLSISIEIAVALLIAATTAVATSFSPG